MTRSEEHHPFRTRPQPREHRLPPALVTEEGERRGSDDQVRYAHGSGKPLLGAAGSEQPAGAPKGRPFPQDGRPLVLQVIRAGHGFWKPASWRIFCPSGEDSQATNAAAAPAFSEPLRVAAG